MAKEITGFQLHKVELIEGGLKVSYTETTVDEKGNEESNDIASTLCRPPHYDLHNIFKGFSEIISEALVLDEGVGVTVEKASFAGKNDNRGVSLSGYLEGVAFGCVRFKTGRIKYLLGESNPYASLTVLCQQLTSEVQEYIYNGKCAEEEVFE